VQLAAHSANRELEKIRADILLLARYVFTSSSLSECSILHVRV
jgi:hypothetical protein